MTKDKIVAEETCHYFFYLRIKKYMSLGAKVFEPYNENRQVTYLYLCIIT